LIRHAEAHPSSSFEDGNYVAAGQWSALAIPTDLPSVLRGQGALTLVYSVDPAQSFPVPDVDYDTIWTVKLDSAGNLTVDNALCEGIDSSQLPATAPI
jgi:hypothetical protein